MLTGGMADRHERRHLSRRLSQSRASQGSRITGHGSRLGPFPPLPPKSCSIGRSRTRPTEVVLDPLATSDLARLTPTPSGRGRPRGNEDDLGGRLSRTVSRLPHGPATRDGGRHRAGGTGCESRSQAPGRVGAGLILAHTGTGIGAGISTGAGTWAWAMHEEHARRATGVTPTGVAHRPRSRPSVHRQTATGAEHMQGLPAWRT